MKHKYKVMIAYSVHALLGLLLGYSLGKFTLTGYHPILFLIVVIGYGFATISLPQYIIKRIK